MRSFVNKLADHRDFKFEHEVKLCCPPEYIDKQLRHITRGSKKSEDAKVLQAGDVAMLKLESDMKKFNSPCVPITVDSGLFDEEFEQKLIGRKTGEEFTAEVNGKKVKVTVISAKRYIYPQPDDEMVRKYVADKDDMKDISTVQQYIDRVKSDYIKEQKTDAIFGLVNDLIEYVLTHSDWEFDDEELEKVYNDMLADMHSWLKEEMGLTFEEMSDDEIMAQTGAENKEQLLEMMRADSEQAIASAIFAHTCTDGKKPEEIDINEIYDIDWKFLQDYAEENIKFIEE